MPWSPSDASKFKKNLSSSQKDQWASVANNVLARKGSEAQAIKTANTVSKSAIKRRMSRRRDNG